MAAQRFPSRSLGTSTQMTSPTAALRHSEPLCPLAELPPDLPLPPPPPLSALKSQAILDRRALNSSSSSPSLPSRFEHKQQLTYPTPPVTRSASPSNDVFAVEISEILREWNCRLKRCLIDQQYERFQMIKTLIDALYKNRKQLNNVTLSPDQVASIQAEMKKTIEKGNQLLEMDVQLDAKSSNVPSDDSVNGDMLNVVDMYRLHGQAAGNHWSTSPFVAKTVDESANKRKSIANHDAGTSHLFFDLKACVASICGPGETTELFFSLYNKTMGKFVSEDFLVRLTFNGMPRDEDKIGKLCTIFADLSKRDLTSEMYLICRIIRAGRMILSDKDMNSHTGNLSAADDKIYQSFRRPFGYGVLNISDVVQGKRDMNGEDGDEQLMRIYTATNESSFPTLFENIINKSGGFETVSRAEMMCVAVRLLNGSISTLLHNDLCHLRDMPVTQRMGFPDIILPGDVRNSIYLTLNSGEFSQGRKTTAKNIEIALQVRLSDGRVLPGAIFIGSGETPADTFESVIYYHTNLPKWQETVRLDIPIERFDRGTHVFVTFRHCSSSDKGDKSDKTFAFAVLPLMRSDDTVIKDGNHMMHLFKFDKKLVTPDVYVPVLVFSAMDCVAQSVDVDGTVQAIPENALSNALLNSKLQATKEHFFVKTALCSTKLTQDVSLLNLLRWKTLPQADMRSVLKDFTFIGPLEIIKYLQDIFDALCSILQNWEASSMTGDIPDLVFSAMVFVLNIILSDRRFINFRPILEVYINKHYGKNEAIDLIWSPLLRSMLKLSRHPKDPMVRQSM